MINRACSRRHIISPPLDGTPLYVVRSTFTVVLNKDAGAGDERTSGNAGGAQGVLLEIELPQIWTLARARRR